MALIACTECNNQISSKALSCPQCGAPANSSSSSKAPYSKNLSSVIWASIIAFVAGCLWLATPSIPKKPDLPPLPVKVGYRSALAGPGLVLTVKNNSTRTLSILANLNNPTMSNMRNYRLDISPGAISEVGHLEGWVLVSGDKIKLSNSDYLSWEGVIP